MTDKKQHDALELASAAESADLAGHPTAKKANAYCLCLLEDCAHMIRKLHSENESLHAERERNLDSIQVSNEIINKKNAENAALQQGYAAARLEIESLQRRVQEVGAVARREHERADRAMRAAQPATADDRAAFKAYLEDCDECAIVPDIAGAFHAGWTSRVRAAQPAGVQQPGAAYAAQDSEHQRAIMEAERNASLDAYSRVVYLSGAESRLYEAGFTNGWQRASHGQAPAQAAPANTEVLEVLRAFAEGRINHLNQGLCPDIIEGHESRDPDCRVCRALDEAAPAAGAVAWSGEVVAHRVVQKRLNGEWASDARDWSDGPPSRALVDSIRADKGRWRIDVAYAAPAAQEAHQQVDALDAARLDWLDEDGGNHVSKVGKTWYTRPAYGRPYRKHKNLRAAIDAARKQGGA